VHADLDTTVDELRALRDRLLAAPTGELVSPGREASGRNLEHYLALRSVDVRPLQTKLTSFGLSSLGRAEPNVLAIVQAALRAGDALRGAELDEHLDELQGAPHVGEGHELLAHRTDTLFGSPPQGRTTRIMVTMPSEAAADESLVRALVEAGMDSARVNTAHDDPDTWRAMVRHVRAVEDPARPVMILFDLAGPKIRTGPLRPGPAVVKIRPRRDRTGVVVEPARRWLVPPDARQDALRGGQHEGHLTLPVDRSLRLRRGHVLRLIDARGATRRWTVVAETEGAVLVETSRTCYVGTGTELFVGDDLVAAIGELLPLEQAWEMTAGDLVVLTDDLSAVEPEVLRIGCHPSGVLGRVEPGHRVSFDDGRVAGVVERVEPGEVSVRISWPTGRRIRVRSRKGINLPDSDIGLAALTDADLRALDVAVEVADAVSLSFVGSADDVASLQRALRERAAEYLGVVVKIETLRGFRSLPSVIHQLMHSRSCGLMIARGDLAVEVGFERLAEVQEEVLWLAEAAHLPVIWATEVLDGLARSGKPTRAEITDAAVSDRAECVMLNKGPFVAEAVSTLADILSRMDAHVFKKQSLLRELSSWASVRSCSPH
jgi:pyruvate kinase